jgi:hypothetical protein
MAAATSSTEHCCLKDLSCCNLRKVRDMVGCCFRLLLLLLLGGGVLLLLLLIEEFGTNNSVLI